jgi:hypothetical protein
MFHDFMFVNRAPPPPRAGKFSSTALVQSLAKTKSLLHYSSTIRTIRRLFADYSYYSSTIGGLFVLFVDYSRTIRTIRRLFALFVDYSHYSLHYSSFINYPTSCARTSIADRTNRITARTAPQSTRNANAKQSAHYI